MALDVALPVAPTGGKVPAGFPKELEDDGANGLEPPEAGRAGERAGEGEEVGDEAVGAV